MYNQSRYQGLSLRGQGQGQGHEKCSRPRPRPSPTLFSQGQGQGHKHFSRPRQGHIISRPTETATITQQIALQLLRQNYAYLIKHNAKETICDGFGVQY